LILAVSTTAKATTYCYSYTMFGSIHWHCIDVPEWPVRQDDP
jgi:hypothetical protein